MYQHGSSITCFAEVDADDITDGSVASCSVFLWLASSEDLRLSLVDVTSKTILREIPLLYQVAKVSEATGLLVSSLKRAVQNVIQMIRLPGELFLFRVRWKTWLWVTYDTKEESANRLPCYRVTRDCKLFPLDDRSVLCQYRGDAGLYKVTVKVK